MTTNKSLSRVGTCGPKNWPPVTLRRLPSSTAGSVPTHQAICHSMTSVTTDIPPTCSNYLDVLGAWCECLLMMSPINMRDSGMPATQTLPASWETQAPDTYPSPLSIYYVNQVKNYSTLKRSCSSPLTRYILHVHPSATKYYIYRPWN